MPQPYINPTQDPNYLGYTRDIPSAPVDASYGKLFENLGNLIGGAAKGVDTLIEDSAKKDARKIIQERIQDPYTSLTPPEAAGFGVVGNKANAKAAAQGISVEGTDQSQTADEFDQPGSGDDPGEPKATPGGNLFDFLSGKDEVKTSGGTPLSAGRTEPVPGQVQGEIDQNITQLQRLQQGRGVGIISPTYLYTQYTAAAKALYSKYPGYEDVIDQEFHKLTGVVPANAQIHAIWQNFQNIEAQQNSAANKWQTELHGMVKDIPGPNAAAFMAAGQSAANDPVKQAQLRVQWANYRGSSNAITQDKAKTELDLANRKLTVENAEDRYQNTLYRTVGQTIAGIRLMAGADGQGGWSMSDLQGKLNEVARNPALLKEQDALIRPALNQLYSKVSAAVNTEEASPGWNQIPLGTKTAARESALRGVKDIIDSYSVDGKQGVATAGLMAHYLEQLNTGDAAQLSAAVPALRVVGAVSKIGGSYIASDVFTKLALGEGGKDISLLSPENREAVRGVVFNGMLGKGNFWNDLVPKDARTGEVDKKAVTPDVISKKIEAFNQLIAHPDATPEMRQNMAKYLVGPQSLELIKEFDAKSQDKVYSWLNNPTTRDAIYKEGQSNPQLWTNYKSWATDTLLSSTMDRSASLSTAIKNSALNVRWDEATGQLLYDTPGPRLDQFGRPMQLPYAPDDVKTLQNFNLSLKSLQGIYDKDGEKISKTVLPTFIRNSAIPPVHGLDGEGPQKIQPPAKSNFAGEGKEQQTASLSPTQQLDQYVKSKQDAGNFDVDENRFKPNQAHVSEKWGNPFTADFKEKNLTTVSAGGQDVLVNKTAAPAFQGFLKDLEATGYHVKSIGGYSLRAKKGNADSVSQHAFGNAIDINPSTNAFGSSKTDMPPQVADLARKWGLSWGGQWKSVRDPMHFEFSGR